MNRLVLTFVAVAATPTFLFGDGFVINEFVASNRSGLRDDEGDFVDWIEVLNEGPGPADLSGWYLTDDFRVPRKWRFPDSPELVLEEGEHLVVFASGKNRTLDPFALHTNFSLTSAGEFLGLVEPNGSTFAHVFTSYPEQYPDISYGLAVQVEALVGAGSTADYIVPGDGSLGLGWTEPDFVPGVGWTRDAPTGLGYSTVEQGPAVPAPVSLWSFDGSLADSVGPNDGTKFGGAAQYISDRNGSPSSAMSFDGASDYISVDQNAFLPAYSRPAYTIAMWVRGNPQNDKRVWSEGSSSNNSPLFTIGTERTGSTGQVDIFIRYANSGGPAHMISDGVAFDGSWHHIAWVDVGGNAAVYIDGIRDPADFSYGKESMALDITAIGAVLRSSACCHYDGEIDDVGVWDRALTPLEIEALAGGAGPGSLFGQWIGTDVESEMHEIHPSIYARMPFQIDAPTAFESLVLRMRHDDGFVAYLNGVEVAARNAPGALAWNSSATADRDATDAVIPESISLTGSLGLLAPGANVLAIHGLNRSANDGEFLLQPELVATGARATSARYLRPPTPGEPNGSGFVDFVADTRFSVDRGFYDEPFDVEITTETPGAQIRYTVDGSEPTATHGTVYSGPIRIDGTTTLRAAAFRSGFESTNVDTHTYIFLEDVIRQRRPAGYPTTWAGLRADYDMDPEICTDVGSPDYEPTIIEDLKAIPSISLVLDSDDFIGSGGIYQNPQARGESWERGGSAELIVPDASEPGFAIRCGIRMQGGSSARAIEGKHSFRLVFTTRHGPSKLRYPMYPESDVETFDTLILRCFSTDSWHFKDGGSRYRRWDSQYIRDLFMKRSQLAMGQLAGHDRYVHLYVNGIYWGLYNPTERPDDSFNAEHQGGEKDDWDVIKDFTETFRGNRAAWDQMFQLANSGLASRAAYERIQGNNPDGTRNPALPQYLDVENLIDYMILHLYGCSEDWPHHNWYSARNRTGLTGGFRFFTWDQEIVMDFQFRNRVNVSNDGTPAGLYARARANPEFNLHFADRVQKHFFNDGALTIESARERWMGLANEIDRAIVGESARWGDFRDDVPDPGNSPAELYTRDRHWLPEQAKVINEYIPDSHRLALERFRSAGLYPDVAPPEYNQHGGEIEAGFVLGMSAPEGTIYYTLDGEDPRSIGGSVSPSAGVFGVGTVTTVLASGAACRAFVPTNGALGLDWIDPDFNDSAWREGTTGIGYERTSGFEELIGTDVRDVMDGTNASVYARIPFELESADADNLTLRMKYDDGFVAYLNGVEVASRNAPAAPEWSSRASAPHADAEAVVFESIDISDRVNLLRAGTNVLAIHGLNASESSTDMIILPELAVSGTTGGATIRLEETTRVRARALADGDWSALQDAVFAIDPMLRITELMYHPAAPVDGETWEQDEYEFIELQNIGDTSLDLDGFRFARGIEFEFADGAVGTLAPGEVVVIVENELAFAERYDVRGMLIAGQYRGKLANTGEELELLGPLGEIVQRFEFDDLWHADTDGLGPSLVIADALAERSTWGDGASWRASEFELGSPGIDESAAPGALRRPGDANGDGIMDISDAVRVLVTLFGGANEPLPCGDGSIADAANLAVIDVNGDAAINLSDAVYMLGFLFQAGPAPVNGTDCTRVEGCEESACR